MENIRDIHGLDAELAALEEHYGLLSDDFYHFYRAGELEQNPDFIRWAGFYEAKQDREASYRADSDELGLSDWNVLYQNVSATHADVRK